MATIYTTFSFGYHNLKINGLQYKMILFSTAKSKQSLCRPVQACTGPEGSRNVEAPRFLDNRHMKVVRCQHYALAAFNGRKYSWYNFPLERESTPMS